MFHDGWIAGERDNLACDFVRRAAPLVNPGFSKGADPRNYRKLHTWNLSDDAILEFTLKGYL